MTLYGEAFHMGPADACGRTVIHQKAMALEIEIKREALAS